MLMEPREGRRVGVEVYQGAQEVARYLELFSRDDFGVYTSHAFVHFCKIHLHAYFR